MSVKLLRSWTMLLPSPIVNARAGKGSAIDSARNAASAAVRAMARVRVEDRRPAARRRPPIAMQMMDCRLVRAALDLLRVDGGHQRRRRDRRVIALFHLPEAVAVVREHAARPVGLAAP